MPLLALVVELHISAGRTKDVFPISLQRLQTGPRIGPPSIRPGIPVAGNVPGLIDRAAGLCASLHSKDDLMWFIYTPSMLRCGRDSLIIVCGCCLIIITTKMYAAHAAPVLAKTVPFKTPFCWPVLLAEERLPPIGLIRCCCWPPRWRRG